MFNRFLRGQSKPVADVPDVTPRPPDLRHPRLPPEQRLTEKWPVLHYMEPRAYDMAKWDFRVTWACGRGHALVVGRVHLTAPGRDHV